MQLTAYTGAKASPVPYRVEPQNPELMPRKRLSRCQLAVEVDSLL